MSKVVIFGSRGMMDFQILCEAVKESGFDISEVVSGCCKDSPDELGEKWGFENGIPIKYFPAKWEDLEAPNAVIRVRKNGRRYNVRAGHDRNKLMALYGDKGIGLWDGTSSGTEDMIKALRGLNKEVYVKRVRL